MSPGAAKTDAERILNRPDIQDMIESLAVKVHDAWAQQREAEGWTWGKVHDAELKRHPCLVDYARLPESEKEVDRRTARTAIQGLLDLGFEILPPKPKQANLVQEFAEVLQRLGSTASIPLAELRSIWSQCKSGPAGCPPEVHLRLGERMLKQGEAILAYDVLSEGLGALEQEPGAKQDRGKLHLRLTQLVALALAQSGASERARGLLIRLREQGLGTPETLGLLGRVYKDLAGKAGSQTQRSQCLAQSFESYFAGFEQAEEATRSQNTDANAGDASYCGINAAAVQVLQGRAAKARPLADRVKQICLERSSRGAGDYWLAATLAEAELIGGHYAEAEAAYRTAVRLVQGNWRELSSTRRQARLLAAAIGLEPGFVERLFPLISVAVFAAPALARPAAEAQMKAWEQQQKAELKQRLAAAGVVCGYATALSPADLLFIEAMLETGREINVTLSCPRQACRQLFEPAPEWAARFDNLLSRAHSVTEETQPSCLDEGVNRAFSRLRALGAGILRAQRLDADLHVWAMPGVAATPAATYPYETLSEASCPAPAGPPTATDGVLRGENYAIRAMLFGDVKGYSKLLDAELLLFARQFMKRVADVLEGHSSRILSRRTAGDGLFLVFADLEVAAAVALQLRDMVASAQWSDCGLPANLGIRISLDAGPVYAFQDPVTQRDEVCGAYVNRAARIEPITPPNEVYASEAFAALQIAAGSSAFRFDYVGQTQLPKGFGLTPLYCVNRGGGKE